MLDEDTLAAVFDNCYWLLQGRFVVAASFRTRSDDTHVDAIVHVAGLLYGVYRLANIRGWSALLTFKSSQARLFIIFLCRACVRLVCLCPL